MRSVFVSGIFFSLLISGCGSKPISSYTSENTSVNSEIQTHTVDSIALPYRNAMQAEMAEVIGYSDSTLLSYAPESPLGNFVADVVFEAGFEYAQSNSICNDQNMIFSLLNFGGLRKPINKGEITRGDIYELMPFDNAIVILKITKARVLEMVDYLASINGQPVSNALFVIGESTRGFQVGPNNHDSHEEFFVITSDYLAGGGDKMDFLKDPVEVWNTQILIREALISHISQKRNIPYTPVESRMYFP